MNKKWKFFELEEKMQLNMIKCLTYFGVFIGEWLKLCHKVSQNSTKGHKDKMAVFEVSFFYLRNNVENFHVGI